MPISKPTIWQRIKSAFNALSWGSDEVPHSSSGRVHWVPGTNTNWSEIVGDIWNVPAVQACLGYLFRNLLQALPRVVVLNNEKEEVVANHPLPMLLMNPNQEYDYSVMMMGLLLSWECDGNAYLLIERNAFGVPNELWYVPHHMIKRKRDKTTGKRYCEYRIGGKTFRLEPDKDILMLQNGVDPNNPLYGLAPLASAARDGYVLQQSSTYAARSMKNGGMVGAVASPANENSTFDPEEFVRIWSSKTTGDHQGEILAYDVPVNVQFPAFSPQDMAIETVQDRPEANICAIMGIPPQCANLHVGRLSKTYANSKEAREAGWEEKLLPLMWILGMQIGRSLLPQMSRGSEQERLTFDTSNVRPLQPDLDALHLRAREDYKANLIDRALWKLMVDLPILPEDVGVYFSDASATQAANDMADPESKNDD